MFCPHTEFICFIWIWEQTAIISLYNINWLVCITETECVYCVVRTGYLNVIWVICFIWISEQTAFISLYNINRLAFITRTECVYCAVQNEPLKTIQVSFCLHVRFVVDQVSLEQSFLQILLLCTVSIIQPMLHTRICLHAAPRERLAKSGNIKTAMISAVGQQPTVK